MLELYYPNLSFIICLIHNENDAIKKHIYQNWKVVRENGTHICVIIQLNAMSSK